MKRTIKFRKKRIPPEHDVYDPITASYFYTTISDHDILKAAFEVARKYHITVKKIKIRDENAILRSELVFSYDGNSDGIWFNIVDSFLGRMSKYIEKVRWW